MPLMDKRIASDDQSLEATVIPQQNVTLLSVDDQGHRRGNFHNYYAFHPSSNRLDKMHSLLEYIGSSSSRKRPCPNNRSSSTSRSAPAFQYCDLGCNEGDLTIAIANALHANLQQQIHFQGIDIDSKLIERANLKWNDTSEISGHFYVGNVCLDLDSLIPDQSVDLISLLSTTMWIHVHVGDDGLEKVLQLLCQKTRRYIVVEPQPSKCYRNAVVRLRKLGRPELDVSTERLKWRPAIEEHIQRTIEACGFHRVTVKETNTRTAWNRDIQLYIKGTPDGRGDSGVTSNESR